MQKLRTQAARLSMVVGALIACHLSLTTGRSSGADATKLVVSHALSGLAAGQHPKPAAGDDSLAAAVTAARYQIEARKAGGHQAANPQQGYRSVFTREGVGLHGSRDAWRLAMNLTAYGYGQQKHALAFSDFQVQGNRIEYERCTTDGNSVREWYVNRAGGLEQGFTLARAPGAKGAGEKLNLWLELSGDLNGRLSDNEQAILFDGPRAGSGLRYDNLHAFDATGRALATRMELAGNQLKLEVVDEGAIYPVTIDPTFTLQQKLQASDAATGDSLGASAGISGDTAVVGAPFDDGAAGSDQGSAYVFVRSGGVWTQQQKLEASDASGDASFGASAAIDGDTIVVGTQSGGAAYVFVRSGGVWIEQQKLTTGGGISVPVAISGDTIVVGAEGEDSNAGATYVFVRSGGVWTQQQRLVASDRMAFDSFGGSVSINGETLVVGALFTNGAGTLRGSAYVFMRSGGVWTEQQKLEASDANDGDLFGGSVASDGDTIAIGAAEDASGQGAAYVFVRSAGVWTEQQKLLASDGLPQDHFGEAIAISGNLIVVGVSDNAGTAGNLQGSAYVYERSGGVWTEQQQLVAPDAAAIDFFGWAVAIDGTTILVGAEADNGPIGENQGSAYVFVPLNQPPVCSGATPSVSTIWPPNHGLVNVNISGVTDPDGDPVSIQIDQIRQDESADGLGDGHTCPDAAGIGTSTAQVRAERSGLGNGRVYTIDFTADDANGGTCQGSITVCVPKSNHGSCTNDGANYDSTQCAVPLSKYSSGPLCILESVLHSILETPLCLP